MEINLTSWTRRPEAVIAWAFANMHNPIPNHAEQYSQEMLELHGYEQWMKILDDLFDVLATNPHSSVLEFVNTVWYIGGCSRAFQQQLTRTRDAAYCIQSLRIVPVGEFALRGAYSFGPSVAKAGPVANDMYHTAMHDLARVYNRLLELGVETEDARGLLPLNIHSPITMAINVRALVHLLDMRLCHLTQGEYREVGANMIANVVMKMGKRWAKLFAKPCDKLGFCPMPVNCGKTEYKLHDKYKGKNLDVWLRGGSK